MTWKDNLNNGVIWPTVDFSKYVFPYIKMYPTMVDLDSKSKVAIERVIIKYV